MVPMRSLHLRLQEYTDCFAESDPAAALSEISRKGVEGDITRDLTEVTLKYLALALLCAIEEGASRILISSHGDFADSCGLRGATAVQLPKPPAGMARQMIDIVREITGLEEDSGSSKLIWGVREDQLEIDVGVERTSREEILTLSLTSTKERRR